MKLTECTDIFVPLQVDRIYKFKNFKVESSDKDKKSTVRVNQFTLKFNKNTEIKRIDGGVNFPRIKFQFQSLREIPTKKKDETIDVIAICRDVGLLLDVKLANSCASKKRELTLIDKTGQVRN